VATQSDLLSLNGVQHRKLRRLLLDAWRHVPLYRALYEPLGLTERDFADPGILARLPILSKADLVAASVNERVDSRFDVSRLILESTTGSTGQPFSLYIDGRYRRLRNLRFLRGLMSAGYRPWHRMLLLTDRHAGFTRQRNRYYQSVEAPTAELLESYVKVRPRVLYGFTTPLRLLAEYLLQNPQDFRGPRLVVSTAEMLDVSTRETLQDAFDCPVFDFYGMTEMGLVAWQRPGSDGYIMSRNAVLTELLPGDPSNGGYTNGRYRTVMTNLDLRASPIIRFDSGDLAFAENVDGHLRVVAFEGRSIDTIVRHDGTELSPYRITDALRDIPGVRRFKVTQRRLDGVAVDLEVDPSLRKQAVDRIRSILDELLGGGVNLSFGFSDNLVPDGTSKFRPVESRVVRT
jgi:phenylacetate-CoA ligase